LGTGVKKAATVAARSLVHGKPHHAQWLITRKCNYQCLGCNVWKEQDKNELSTEEIKRGLDILREAGIIELVLSGCLSHV
jgi:MoaA/NifB/PqqE/SkfB family radical SAM enzyme